MRFDLCEPASTPSAAELGIRMLGRLSVSVRGAPMGVLRSRQAGWILALLAIRKGAAVDRAWLAGTLWPESSEERALYNLRRNLSEVKRALGVEGYRLVAGPGRTLALTLHGAWTDLEAFDSLVRRGDAASLKEAIALYRGALLEGCDEPWVLPERESAAGSYLDTLDRLAALAMERGDPGAAVALLRQELAADPLREAAVRALMEALARQGEHAAVTHVYRDFRLYLHKELHAAPADETARLYARLHRDNDRGIAGAPPRSAGSLPSPLTALIGRDAEIADVADWLSRCRLVTLTGPGGIGKTRLATAVASAVASRFADGVAFVDLGHLADGHRLVSAIASAVGLMHDSSPRNSADLASLLRNRELLLVLDNCEHIVEAAADAASQILAACRHVRILTTSRQSLGHPGETVWQVHPLAFPHDERGPGDGAAYSGAFKGDREALLEYPAVQLFVERARQARPGSRLRPSELPAIAGVCASLEGIPLAIELAAARLRVFSVDEVRSGMGESLRMLGSSGRRDSARQSTLRASIDWSYELLTPTEKAAFERLAVFAGGWSLGAAAAVCAGLCAESTGGGRRTAAADGEPDIRELVAGLVDKSLVQFEEAEGEPRYRMLATVRQYAAERLRRDDDVYRYTRRLHAGWLLALVERIEPLLRGPDQDGLLAAIEVEHDNVCAALALCLDDQRAECGPGEALLAATDAGSDHPAGEVAPACTDVPVDAGLRTAVALTRYWWLRGRASEGYEWLRKALASGPSARRTVPSARALAAAGKLAHCLGDLDAAERHLGESRDLAVALAAPAVEADALRELGDVAASRGEFDRSAELLRCAQAHFESLGELQGLAETIGRLGYVARERGDSRAAQRQLERSMSMHREMGDLAGEVWALGALGYVYHANGDYDAMDATFARALDLHQASGNRSGEAWCLTSLAVTRLEQDDPRTARGLAHQAVEINRTLGSAGGEGWSLEVLGAALGDLGEVASAQEALERSLAIDRNVGNARGAAHALRRLGDLHRQAGELRAAHEYYAESVAAFRAGGWSADLLEVAEAYAAMCCGAGDAAGAASVLAHADRLRGVERIPRSPRQRKSRATLAAAIRERGVADACLADERALTVDQTVELAMRLYAAAA